MICPARFQVAGHLFRIKAGISGSPKGIMNTSLRFCSFLTRLGLLALIVFVLQSCALFDWMFSKEEDERSPAELMSEGMDDFESGYNESATQAFQELKDKYPYSPYAITA
jgi:hypothetical protein